MKNIHILPTDKPSRLLKTIPKANLILSKSITSGSHWENQNIYITSDEEIREGVNQWYLDKVLNKPYNSGGAQYSSKQDVIILTTDQDLIKDGVQAIDDEFLEWFVKNSSCERVEVEEIHYSDTDRYEIIIPKEEPKQLFTDYPITELGDKEFVEAQIRECELISYDDDKYCYVKVDGVEKEIKRCYIYPQKGRCGEVDCVSVDEIKELLKEEPKTNFFEELKRYFEETPKEKIESDWAKTEKFDKVGPTVEEFLEQRIMDVNVDTGYKYKKETLEEVAESYKKNINYHKYQSNIGNNIYHLKMVHYFQGRLDELEKGAKWQQERSYSEEDMRKAIQLARLCTLDKEIGDFVDLSGLTEICTYGLEETHSENSIIEQFKNK